MNTNATRSINSAVVYSREQYKALGYPTRLGQELKDFVRINPATGEVLGTADTEAELK